MKKPYAERQLLNKNLHLYSEASQTLENGIDHKYFPESLSLLAIS